MVVISPQLEKYSKQLVKKHILTFSVLGDKGNSVASQFGLAFRPPDYLHELYNRFGINLEIFNGDSSWSLPMPGRFVLDQQGKILNADVHPDYTKRPEPADILEIQKDSNQHL
jgi:peroxiredoxin